MDAVILSLLAALFFSISTMLAKKGLMNVDPLNADFISIVIAVPILTLFCLLNGDFSYLYLLDQFTIIYLALAGILHFILGRTFAYYSNKIIGASRSATLLSTNLVFTSVLGALI